MNKIKPSPLVSSLIGFSLCLSLPSLGQVQKYLGNSIVFVYIISVFLVILFGYRHILKRLQRVLTEKRAMRLVLITFFCLMLVFVIVYPIINANMPGKGSDRDDDLDLSTKEFLKGDYPYYCKTYLGNSITHFPGSIFLAVPFLILFGKSAYQNFFWLLIFVFLARKYLKSASSALILFWVVLFLSPVVIQELLTGGDLISNGIYVLTFSLFMFNCATNPGTVRWKKILSALLLGIALSSRANFILVLPLVFSALISNAGLKSAIKYVAITLVAFTAITIPFYIYDPRRFSPFSVSFNKINQFSNIFPFSGIIITSASILFVLILSFGNMDREGRGLLKKCALLQALPVLCVTALQAVQMGGLNLILSGYGLNFLFFGVLGFGADILDKTKSK